MRNQKSFIFVMTLMVLLIGLTAISAADTSNTTITSDVATPTVNTHTSDLNKIASDNSDVKSLKTETKIVKKIDNTKIINEKSKVWCRWICANYYCKYDRNFSWNINEIFS